MKKLLLMLVLLCSPSVAGETSKSVYGPRGNYQGSIRKDTHGNIRIYNQRYQMQETWRKSGPNYYRYNGSGKYIGQVRK